jgi:hypothetical protein
MSYTYLQEQGEESSVDTFSDIPQYVLSRLNLTAERFSCNGNETASCQSSQFGMMSAHSTESLGEEKSMSFAEDSLAKTSQVPVMEQEFLEPEAVYGRRCSESLVKYNPDTHSWKILHCLWEEDLPLSSLTLPNWGMMQDGECWELIMSELSIIEPACGWLPTPVASERQDGMGVAWKLARLYKGDRIARYLGKIWISRNLLEKNTKICPNPCWQEWRMMWPINWTGLNSLGMDKWQEWRRQHSDFFQNQ